MLTRKEAEFRSVERLTEQGRQIVRVSVRYSRTKPGNNMLDGVENTLDLDPALGYAVVRGETRGVKESQLVYVDRFEASYSLENGIPVTKKSRFETRDKDGTLVKDDAVEVLSTSFGPTPEAEFSLAAAGITEVPYGPAGGFPISFYVSVVLAVVSMLGLLLLRWRSRAKAAT
jgi:hypothetical protein